MTMRLRLLGNSGIRVSELCLGTMTFGTEWAWGADEAECRVIYGAFREAGGNFVDTSSNYTDGTSERILGRLIAHERDEVVVGTKFTFPTAAQNPNSAGAHRKSLRISVEGSLQRLSTDHLDVLWVHAWDQCTPIDETMRALDDLVRAGKVLAVGCSNMPAWVASQANAVAGLRGWTPFSAMQVQYSLAERSADADLLPMAHAHQLATLAWSPLGRGRLTGKHDADQLSPTEQRVVDLVSDVAQQLGVTRAQVALAWVRQQGLMPVLGARSREQIADNLGSLAVQLNDGQFAMLDDATRIDRGYPHEWLDARHRRAVFTREGVEGSR